MLIKLITVFLLFSVVSFLVLPLEVINFAGEDAIISADIGIYRHYEWFGVIKQADNVANNPLSYLTNSYNYEPYVRLAIQSLVAGLLLTFIWYFFISRKTLRT
jgi:hypothetical protein